MKGIAASDIAGRRDGRVALSHDYEIVFSSLDERICVGGAINSTVWPDNRKKSKSNRQVQEMDYEVEFGYSFPRPPTVLASITALNNGRKKSTDAQVHVKSVSDTSAVLHLARWMKSRRGTQCSFGWLACLWKASDTKNQSGIWGSSTADRQSSTPSMLWREQLHSSDTNLGMH